MTVWRSSVIGLGVAFAIVPAFAQAPSKAPVKATPLPPSGTVALTAPAQSGTPHTLAEALAAPYATHPALLAERARLRATDENVPQALSGWRPTVIMAGTAGYGDGFTRTYSGVSGQFLNAQTDRLIGTAQATLTQPLYTGGKTQGNINRAKNQVMAERANLINQEQTSFTNVVERLCWCDPRRSSYWR